MKIFIILLMAIPAFSQKIIKVRGDNILISGDDISLEEGKKYFIETESGEALIGTYTNASTGSGFVAKILEGDVAEGDRISSYRKKKVGGSSGSSIARSGKPFQFGIFLGANQMSGKTVEQDSGEEISSTDAGTGFQGGAIAEYNFSPKVALNTKLGYHVTTTSGELTIGGATFTRNTDLSFVALQPTIKFRFSEMFNVFAGVRAGMAMGFTQNTEDSNGNPVGQEVDLLDEATQTAGNFEVASFGLDIPLGLGVKFNLGNLTVEPNFTYYLPIGASIENNGVTPAQEVLLSNMALNIDVLF